MLSKNIKFKNFSIKKKNLITLNNFNKLKKDYLKKDLKSLLTLSKNYN